MGLVQSQNFREWLLTTQLLDDFIPFNKPDFQPIEDGHGMTKTYIKSERYGREKKNNQNLISQAQSK